MTYQRFEDLPVWKETARLYDLADDFLQNAPPGMRHSFRHQFERAVLSVSNNIAERFERGTTNELLQFIYIARDEQRKKAAALRKKLLANLPVNHPLRRAQTQADESQSEI